jgi:hypothetical protein
MDIWLYLSFILFCCLVLILCTYYMTKEIYIRQSAGIKSLSTHPATYNSA